MKLIKVAIPTALALGLIAAGPASAQSRHGGGGGGGGQAAARGGAVVAAPRGGGGYPGGGHVASSHGPVYVAPRGHAVAVPRSYGYGYGGNHYHAPYYGHYPSYGYGYGYAHYAPYYRPYYYGNPYLLVPVALQPRVRPLPGLPRALSVQLLVPVSGAVSVSVPGVLGTRLPDILRRTRIRIRRSIRAHRTKALPTRAGSTRIPRVATRRISIRSSNIRSSSTGTTSSTRSLRAAR